MCDGREICISCFFNVTIELFKVLAKLISFHWIYPIFSGSAVLTKKGTTELCRDVFAISEYYQAKFLEARNNFCQKHFLVLFHSA